MLNQQWHRALNCLPFLGLENKVREMGGFSMAIYDRAAREMT